MKKLIFNIFITLLAFFSFKTESYAQLAALQDGKTVQHVFAELPYAYDALEPYIDKATMEIHYSRHHKAYYDNFMKATQGTPFANMTMQEIFAKNSDLPMAVRNNGGGYWNHEFFWNIMIPGGSKTPQGSLAKAIEKSFGSFDEFKQQFADAGLKRFGSGWVWLVVSEGKLFITTTANQDNPYMNTETVQGIPILAVDVWEHAYYLKYQNKRADYLNAFWNVVNWSMVGKNYEQALKQ